MSAYGPISDAADAARLVALGMPKVPAQAAAIVLVTPWNFIANKLWSFRRREPQPF